MTVPTLQPLSVTGTLSISNAAQETWDTLVIGAGVAGSATAILAAQQGLRVLLVESKSFPREKVCGGCLNQRAQNALARLGVLDQVLQSGSVALNEIHVQVNQLGYTWPIPSMQSIRRSTLDSLLASQAISMGVAFLPNTIATVDHSLCSIENNTAFHNVRVRKTIDQTPTDRSSESITNVRTKSIVVAAGLNRSALKPTHQWPSKIESNSRIGVQTIVNLDELRSLSPELGMLIGNNPNQLHMLASNSGYVGICMTDYGLVDIASAIDPNRVSSKHPIHSTVSDILRQCGIDTHNALASCEWMATPLLTRRSELVATPGLFLAGDSLGYIEPFTGEGMSWALDNAENLAPLLRRVASNYEERTSAQKEWISYVDSQRKIRQRICRWVAQQARHPVRSQWVLRACQWFAPLRNRLLKEAVQ